MNRTCWMMRKTLHRLAHKLLWSSSDFILSRQTTISPELQQIQTYSILKVFEIWSHNFVFSQIFDHTNQKTLSSGNVLPSFAHIMDNIATIITTKWISNAAHAPILQKWDVYTIKVWDWIAYLPNKLFCVVFSFKTQNLYHILSNYARIKLKFSVQTVSFLYSMVICFSFCMSCALTLISNFPLYVCIWNENENVDMEEFTTC